MVLIIEYLRKVIANNTPKRQASSVMSRIQGTKTRMKQTNEGPENFGALWRKNGDEAVGRGSVQ